MMTIGDFLLLTWEWLTIEYEVGTLDLLIQKVRNIINITQQRAQQWWSWAKRLAIWGTIISLIIFLAGIIIGGFTHLGWPNSVAGLLIAPILFVLLAWWTPLVAIIAVIYEIAHGRARGAIDIATAQAKWWLGLTCGILLWQVLVSLAFTFIPYWNAPSRIPVLMLLALAMALIGIRWNNVTWYRSVIKFLVIGAFIAQVSVCFLPATATALHSKMGEVDESIAENIKNGFSNKGQTAVLTSSHSPGFETMPVGVHHFTVQKDTSTDWIKIPDNAYWDLFPVKDGNWKLINFQGKVVTYQEGEKKYADFPNQIYIFKIQTDEKMDFILKVKQIT